MAQLFFNNAHGVLDADITAEDTTLHITQSVGLPSTLASGDWFLLTLYKDSGQYGKDHEIVRVTSVAPEDEILVCTVERGVEMPAVAHVMGERVESRLTAGTMERMIPFGVITMWSGAVNAIPGGWALCDGSNGTPNLLDRFIVGAGGDYEVGDTGGAANVTLTEAQIPAHSHSGSTESAGSHSHSGSASSAGAHTHNIQEHNGTTPSGTSSGTQGINSSGNQRKNKSWRNIRTSTSESAATAIRAGSTGAHTHSLSINSGGAHTHSVSVSNTGGGESHENRPPYYALAYIMKL